MYLPYLRGKQYELIALRELCSVMAADRENISPIIEPVKDSSTLKSCISCLAQNDINFSVIINPSVGKFREEPNHIDTILNYLGDLLGNYQNWQIGVLIDRNTSVDLITRHVLRLGFDKKRFTLIHNAIRKDISNLLNEFSNGDHIENNVINYTKINDRRRYHRAFLRETLVSLDDFFASQVRNADYGDVDESEFSVEHLYFREEGFKGFSDFLTIGEPYSDTGFLPYAVAIHLSYADEEKNIKVKHFVSNSNDDASDVAGKFAEALDKLIEWCNENNILETEAIKEFKDLHGRGHFPGLGSIKKLSVMHHIELVLSLLRS